MCDHTCNVSIRARLPSDIIRYGKGGKAIYLSASYNPITDDSGRPNCD